MTNLQTHLSSWISPDLPLKAESRSSSEVKKFCVTTGCGWFEPSGEALPGDEWLFESEGAEVALSSSVIISYSL